MIWRNCGPWWKVMSESMAKQEQAIARRHTLAVRDAALTEVIGMPDAAASWNILTARIGNRIAELTKLADDDRNRLIKAQNDLEELRPVVESDVRINGKTGAGDRPPSHLGCSRCGIDRSDRHARRGGLMEYPHGAHR